MNARLPKALPPGVELSRVFSRKNPAQTRSIAFHPLGRILAAGGGADYRVTLWDLDRGRSPRELESISMPYSLAFDSSGMLACGSIDGSVTLWDVKRGKLLRTLKGDSNEKSIRAIFSLAFYAGQQPLLAGGGYDQTVSLWNPRNGALLRTLRGHTDWVWSVAFSPCAPILATASDDRSVKLWDARSGELLQTFDVNSGRGRGFSVAFDPSGEMIASGGGEAVKLWDVRSGKLRRTLEGHTGNVANVAFSREGQLLATRGEDSTIRIWSSETWETVASIPILESSEMLLTKLAFSPAFLNLAAINGKSDDAIHLWKLDVDVLRGRSTKTSLAAATIHHTTAKIVLLGDHSVGKSALGYRLIHNKFERQESTHGQQFWVYPELGYRRTDGTQCEAILWDFAGQPDYRLVHALFIDNADLAIILFDASDLRDPLHGVEFWLKQLQAGQHRCPIILVAAQTDRGTSSLTPEELRAFCEKQSIVGPIPTSALTGAGVDELIERMKAMITWDDKPAIVTTATFKRVKDYVLGLKEKKSSRRIIVTPRELRTRLAKTDVRWRFTDAEMMTAAGHLENYGYVKRLRTSQGEERVLLQPERLNNLASSFVLEARRNPKGLGALEEKRLLAGGYDFAELEGLNKKDHDVLLDAAVLLFLEHNVCYRETDPLRNETYLVFPELINLKKPAQDDAGLEDGVTYTVSGATENVFASLVVLLGYTHTFTRTAQWQNNARYEVGNGMVCTFRQAADRDGELDLVLGFGKNVGEPVRKLFYGLFESFLARRHLTVIRHEPVCCPNGHLLDRSLVRQRAKEGKTFSFCPECGEKLMLPAMAEPIQLARDVQARVSTQHQAAEQRTEFEQAIFRVKAYAADQKIKPPETFISYAWGVAEHERWVEKRLAADLQKAGIDVVLDRWHSAQIGASVPRFVERIQNSDKIVMVGTPDYLRKYENKAPGAGYVVAAEVDLISDRLLGTEQQKESVLPLLLAGEAKDSLPPLLRRRVYADFRGESAYFATAFDLILSLYRLPPIHPAVADLREPLRKREFK